MKSRNSNLYNEKEEHSNIQWMNECSPSPQHWQTFGQLLKNSTISVSNRLYNIKDKDQIMIHLRRITF